MAGFPDTQWSLIRRSGETPSARHAAFSVLARDYRPAILAYFRARLAPADAEDATQSFLAASFEHGWWARAETEAGSFRRFLLMLLRRHLSHLRGARHGDEVSSDGHDPADPAPGAEQHFDARFVLLLTSHALDALRERYRERGRGMLFPELVRLLGAPPEHGQLQHAATALGLSANALTVELKRLRARLNEQLRHELRQLCADEDAFMGDWAALRQILDQG